MKRLFRKILRPFLYYFHYLPNKKSINVNRGCKPLLMGITAVVAMKNEEYTLPFCLESLVGFADQIVIIDNGSEDSSLEKAKSFKQQFGSQVEVDILEMPGALLGDCREAGLKTTRYQWHLRWDADMVAHTDGVNDMKQLRKKILKDNTPRAIQLPRVNLNGDLHHCNPKKVIDGGEPILVWFSSSVAYREYGKFDTIKVPLFYKQSKESKYYYFHCQGLKSDENLIHRFHYFVWREILNKSSKQKLSPNLLTLEQFKHRRNENLFNTNDPSSVKYRYMKQLVPRFKKFSSILPDFYYPEILRKEINSKSERFKIIYDNGTPITRIDTLDIEMMYYKPTESDLNWNVNDFFDKLYNEKYL